MTIFYIILGIVIGVYGSWNYFRKRSKTYLTVNMTAEEATDLIESEEAVKKLKKEMGW